MEEIERPSFENFLSKPSNLSDHLKWQLGSIPVSNEVREAAEVVIGNLSEDGYLIASDDEMLGIVPAAAPEADAALVEKVVKEAAALGLDAALEDVSAEEDSFESVPFPSETSQSWTSETGDSLVQIAPAPAVALAVPEAVPIPTPAANSNGRVAPAFHPNFNLAELHEAIELVRQMDPPGVACRDLRECLLQQLRYHQQQFAGQQEWKRRSDGCALCGHDRRG